LGAVVSGPVLVWLLAGILLGAFVGLLPGLGGAAAVALLIPFVIARPAEQAFALMMGLVAVTATTGDLTSILLGIPGEATSAATVVDGYPLTRRGQSGRAMGASLVSSFVGSAIGALALVVCVTVARPVLARIGSPELFMLCLLGVYCAVPLTSASPLRGLTAGALGFVVATVGLDPAAATPRFTLGQLALWDGIGLIPLTLGIFAIPEIVMLAGQPRVHASAPALVGFRQGAIEALRSWRLLLRSSAIGSAIGLLPGMGASASQWVAYADAARRSTVRSEFGRGSIEGVIAPSAANNATLGGALVPTLSLGVPGSVIAGMLLTALILKGFVPGPQMLIPEQAGGHLTFVFTLAWMIVIANGVILGLVLMAAPALSLVAQARGTLLVPFLLVVTFVGAFVNRDASEDMIVTAVAGIVGLGFARYGWPRAPLLVGAVLGRLAETRLFVSVEAYGLSWVWRPGVVLIAAVIAVTAWRRSRRHESSAGDAAPASAAAATASAGERIMTICLIVACAGGLIATTTFGTRAALFPRLALTAAITMLVASLRVRSARQAASAIVTNRREDGPVQRATIAWVAIFLCALGVFGFPWGAGLATIAYLATHREPPFLSVAMGVGAFIFLEGVMTRLLHVPLPAGMIAGWAL
jgi:putative tricarboxylic transport membrane protein